MELTEEETEALKYLIGYNRSYMDEPFIDARTVLRKALERDKLKTPRTPPASVWVVFDGDFDGSVESFLSLAEATKKAFDWDRSYPNIGPHRVFEYQLVTTQSGTGGE